MAAQSNMMALGTKAPEFTLLDTVSGKQISLNDVKSDIATVILFICNHCPYVVHIQDRLAEIAKEYQAKGISFIGISANDADTYPADAPDKMKLRAIEIGYTFPYCYDDTQEVAKAYDAQCTPDIYVFHKDLNCVFRGQFDDTRPGSGTATGNYLTNALDNILSRKEVDPNQKPSIGCSIKWK